MKVFPISNKAKNRFHNIMNSCSDCIIEQETDQQFFLRSFNGKYFFWMNKINDPNWKFSN